MSDYGHLTEVTAEPRATTLEVDASIGDTTLTVDYAGDFNSVEGGTLDLNGDRLDYTGITDGAQPDDPDLILLTVPLAAGASAGDAVSVVAGGQVLVDYFAHVTIGDIGDEVLVPLKAEQVPMWPQGAYADPVPVEVSDDLQHLQDAPGRTVTVDTGDSGDQPRVAVFYPLDVPALGGTEGSTGSSIAWVWRTDTAASQGLGSDIIVSATDSKIKICTPGIYAFSWSIFAAGIRSARVTSGVSLRLENPYLESAYDAILMGGMQNDSEPTGSITFYVSQAAVDAGPGFVEIAYRVIWQDYDTTSITDTYIDAYVQRIGGGRGPKGDPGTGDGDSVPVGTPGYSVVTGYRGARVYSSSDADAVVFASKLDSDPFTRQYVYADPEAGFYWSDGTVDASTAGYNIFLWDNYTLALSGNLQVEKWLRLIRNGVYWDGRGSGLDTSKAIGNPTADTTAPNLVGVRGYSTADRNTLGAAITATGDHYMVFDTTLGKPIWSDGAGGWVDATGASV